VLYSVTRFCNWRLAHVVSRQPDIGAWHRLYTFALLWSQDSWSSLFIGTSYKDDQVKRRCVREKFREWSLEVWVFKFYIKNCYIRRTCSSETKQNFAKSCEPIFKCMRISTYSGRFRTKDLTIHICRRSWIGYNDTYHIYGKFGIYTQKKNFSETSKIDRNCGSPKKNWNSRFQNFEKNRFDDFTKSI